MASTGTPETGRPRRQPRQRAGGLTKRSDTGSKQWEISYSYPLSKRTTVYAGYVKLDNDRNVAYTFNINLYVFNTTCNGRASAAGVPCRNGKPDGFMFGMIHLF